MFEGGLKGDLVGIIPDGLSVYLASSWLMVVSWGPSVRRKVRGLGGGKGGNEGHTAPVVVFSWVLFPLTLKATPLAVVLLTSRVAAEVW